MAADRDEGSSHDDKLGSCKIVFQFTDSVEQVNLGVISNRLLFATDGDVVAAKFLDDTGTALRVPGGDE